MLNTIKWLALLPLVPPISGAKAQQRPATDFTGQDMTPALVLARVCVKEASFTGFADCPPIASVLLRVGRGDVVRGAKLYSPRVFDPARLGRRPWIAQLRADGSQPEGWPENISWRNHRPSWERMVSLARAVLEGPGEAPDSQRVLAGSTSFTSAQSSPPHPEKRNPCTGSCWTA